ncbi:hypothetical protein AOLI_G00288630 [Acnodon oligacanthus]
MTAALAVADGQAVAYGLSFTESPRRTWCLRGRLKSAVKPRLTPRTVKKNKVTMEDLHNEIHQNSGIRTKASEGAAALNNRTLSTQAWSNNLNEHARQALSTDVAVEDSALFTPLPETSLGLIFKMATSLLQPLCLGGSPVVLPVHLQVAGGVDPQVGPAIASPVIAPSPGSLSLPLMLDQPGLQCLSSQLLLQSSCLVPEQQYLSGAEQNHGPSQNLSVPLSQPQPGSEKSDISSPPSDSSALHCSKFTTVLQEPFHFLRNYGSACQGTRSVPSNPFLPQESPMPYLYTGSPLVSLVPPATLLVPYPLIVPLPVPLPIPIPIPIPVSFPESKALSGSPRAAYSTKKNKSTQTSKDAFDIPTSTHSTKSDCRCLQLPRLPLPSVSQQEVLDLRIKVTPIQTQQKVQFPLPQDSALDLSVAANSSHTQSCTSSKLKCYRNYSANEELTERIFHPVKHSQKHEPNRLNSHSDMEFGMQYKWTEEEYFTENAAKSAGQNSRITPAVFCEKLVRQPQEHTVKNRVVKLKRVTSQSMNIHPIKKQHVATFRPTK